MNVTRCTAHEIIVEQRMLLELVIQQEDWSLEGQRIASKLLQQLRRINLLKHWLQQHALFNGLTFIQAAIFSSTFVALRCTGYTTVMLCSDRIQELLTASLFLNLILILYVYALIFVIFSLICALQQ